eukprot:m.221575 g.221575  ORF g.221575 m.221575 type:complete len:359 (-) comp15841_c0_seq1:92-1168(-)
MPRPTLLVSNPVLPVTCHAWNADRTQLAISPDNNEVHIYSVDRSGNMERKFVLKEHTQTVTSIDWAPKTNRIVSCGQDRNAYVWNFDGKEWKPTLVILRINRAATCVRWSPNEDKFATGSGSRLISISYFEKDNDWWVSKHIKKPIRSTVLSIDWHPNNVVIAAGSSDFKARVFSAWVKEVESKPAANSWGAKLPFGEPLAEFSPSAYGGGWVHDVKFSATGDQLLFVSHDSSLSVVDSTQGNKLATFVSKDLPYRCCAWLTPSTIVVAGHDYVPYEYSFTGGEIKFVRSLDEKQKKEAAVTSAMAKFKTMDLKGTTDSGATAIEVESTHQNAIGEIRVLSDKEFSTVGNDGQIVLWP